MLDSFEAIAYLLGMVCILVVVQWKSVVGLANKICASLLILIHKKESEFPITADVAISRRPRIMDTPYAEPRGIMNLRSLRDDHNGMFLDVDDRYLEQIELKRVYFSTPTLRPSVFGIHPPLASHARIASVEALDFIVKRLEQDYPGLVDRSISDDNDILLTNIVTGRYWRMSNDETDDLEHPLCIAAQLVQEDLAIMLPTGSSEDYILGAAAICFADQWRVIEKIGKDLISIHAPVEKYPVIANATSAFFKGLKVGDEKVRYTHTFCERPDLHIESEPDVKDCPLPSTGLPHGIYVRSERQILTRLPKSNGVLFTIRTYRIRLDDVRNHRRAALLAALEMTSSATPLSRVQKQKFGDRIRSRFGA